MNNYNPNIHHRKSIRLKGYDYSQAGLYFVTLCCEGREHRFGKIENDEMVLNEFGTVAYNEWTKLPERFPNFELDVFQIMPNHMHGIIALIGATIAVAQYDTTDKTVGAGFTPAQNGQPETKRGPDINLGQPQGLPLQNIPGVDNGAGVNPAPTKPATIGDIVGAYKSLVTNACIDIYNLKNIRLGKFWQRNYHEHIIRNEQSYNTISQYIINNPVNWNADKFYK
jgi:REP element-mobilizing transposase RayT